MIIRVLQRHVDDPQWYLILRYGVVAIGLVSFLPLALLPFVNWFAPDDAIACLVPIPGTCVTLLIGCSLEAAVRLHRFMQLRKRMARRSAVS